MRTDALREVELSDNSRSQFCELGDRRNDLPVWEVKGFAQAYLHGELDPGLLCALGEKPNYGLIISALAHPARREKCEILGDISPSRNRHVAGHDFGGQQSHVLADNIEIVEGVKKIVPSLVRFARVDDTSFLGGDGLYKFVPFVSPADPDLLARHNWEVSVINKRLAVALGKRGRENIETATDSVDVRASLNLECERERRFFLCNENIIRNVRWLLSEHQLNVVVEPSIQTLLKGWEIGFGPVD